MPGGTDDQTPLDLRSWEPRVGSFVTPAGLRYDLTEPLAKNRYRQIWRADLEGSPEISAIVEFLADMPPSAVFSEPDPQNRRGTVDLGACVEDAATWPQVAIITLLPAALPEPYQRFSLLDFLGMGGMGQVWLAESPDYAIALAVKFMILPEAPSTWLAFAQFQKEAKTGSKITHSCILHTRQFLDLHPHVARGWPPVGMVMEYLPVSLERVLDDCDATDLKLPESVAINFTGNLVDALDEMHQFWKLVHRDIKPSNVMIRLEEGRRYYGARSLPQSLLGSRALLSNLWAISEIGSQPPFALHQDGWKAPELFQDSPDGRRPRTDYKPNPAEDIFALGKLLEKLAERVEGEPEYLKAAARDCMQKDPSERPGGKSMLLMRLSPD